ncbi:uncharacterized protein [Chironomus tepperi]|uniref:uncharacterized protein n=1 Tax=Chironomus tepperi TaxID=113505 RepID=UPI00391F0D18
MESCEDFENSEINGDQIEIDFKSSFARSLSDNTEIIEFDKSKQLAIDCSEHSVVKNDVEVNEKYFTNKFLSDNGFNKSDEDKEKQLWSITKKKHQVLNGNCAIDSSNDAEILRLRKECQNLIEENRRLNTGMDTKHDKSSVQNTVLLTKIETLEWQLKQVENSRHMYRAILEEVSRYLEKCHTSFDIWHQQQEQGKIERSKSISFIKKDKLSYNEAFLKINEADGIRTRSSTNLNCSTPYSAKQKSGTFLSDLSYSSFKDFTWRRPKKNSENNKIEENLLTLDLTTDQIDIQKLSKEAFRLHRTVQNFLCTHEPLLSQSSHDKINSNETSDCSSSSPFENELQISFGSTDDSSNSTKSNFENVTLLSNSTEVKKNVNFHKSSKRSSATEDESGFSSMSSFHEIGLPVPSDTLLENRFSKSNELQVLKRNDLERIKNSKDNHVENDDNTFRVLWV